MEEVTRTVNFRRLVVALVLLGVSFGYVEAAVVVYLRTIYEPLRESLYPGSPAGELFPMITLPQLAASGPRYERLVSIELIREAATLAMLGAVGLAVARNARQWIAAFAVAMGVWDILFYAFLKLLIGWPASILTWDILFLLPVPWAGPVLAPVLVALALIVCGLALLRMESGGVRFRACAWHWTGMIAGALVILASFVWDAPRLMTGAMPHSFRWPLFALGETIGVAVFLHAVRRSGARETAEFRRLSRK